MKATFETENYGQVTIKDCMIDIDGTNLEKGIEILSNEDLFDKVSIFGFTVDDIQRGELDLDCLIEINL